MENLQIKREVNNALQDAAIVCVDVLLVRVPAHGYEKKLRIPQCARVLFLKSC